MALGNHKVEIVVGVRDLASRAFSNISRSATNMSRNFGTMGTALGAFNRTLDTTIMKLDKMANSMYKFNMYTGQLQRNLTQAGMAAGAIGGAVAYQGINSTLQYDYNTRMMQSRMQSSNKVRKDISDYILNDLNLKVGYNPTQISETGIVLGQAGISSSQDMKSMLKTTTFFSEAVDADPTQAAEMMISAAKGWNISMDKSAAISDKLTVALNNSLLHVEELPHAIGQLAGRAALYGQSLDSSLVALMSSRDQGLPAAQAAQNLLHGLSQASRAGNDQVLYKRTRGYFESLGINEGIFNADTRKLKEFPELIADIEQAMIKEGLTNNKYGIKTHDDFKNYIAKNGQLPEDIWDSMKAAPLLSKIFGKAGITPILMGMQTKWEEVDRETGEKTGEVYYGSEALKRMYDTVKNSDGAVEKAHSTIAEAAKFQLNILSGAWQATQVKFLENVLPVIKTSAEELTSWLTPASAKSKFERGTPEFSQGEVEPTGLEKFRKSVEKAADSFRKNGNTTTADYVESIGGGIINGIQVGGTMPPMFKQIADSFNKNIVSADWGSNIVEFPIHLVENGVKFINDLLKANEQFQEAVSKLPKDLQDPAKLVETLVKGGIILLVTGAIVKVIELGIRGVSAALTGTKMAANLATTIANWIKGGGNNNPANALNNNMNIKANIVNVYGPQGAGGGAGAGNRPGNTPGGAVITGGGGAAGASKWTKFLRGAGLLGVTMIGMDIASGAMGGNSLVKDGAEWVGSNVLGNKSDAQVDKFKEILEDPSKYTAPRETKLSQPGKTTEDIIKDFFTPKKIENEPVIKLPELKLPGVEKLDQAINNLSDKAKAEKERNMSAQESFINNHSQIISDFRENSSRIDNSIITGFESANQKIQNLKLDNQVNVYPNFTITGNMPKNAISVQSSGTSYKSSTANSNNNNANSWERMDKMMQRRIGW